MNIFFVLLWTVQFLPSTNGILVPKSTTSEESTTPTFERKLPNDASKESTQFLGDLGEDVEGMVNNQSMVYCSFISYQSGIRYQILFTRYF